MSDKRNHDGQEKLFHTRERKIMTDKRFGQEVWAREIMTGKKNCDGLEVRTREIMTARRFRQEKLCRTRGSDERNYKEQEVRTREIMTDKRH